MRLALIGLPGSGKTSLHNTLTGGEEPVGTFSGVPGGRTAVVGVPDPRLEHLREFYQPKKYTPATYDCVDVTGLISGQAGHAEVSAEILGLVRDMDALVHLVRAFEDEKVPHVLGSVDPARDLQRAREELAFADFAVAEKRIEKLRVQVTKPTPHVEDDKAELAVLERVRDALEQAEPARSAGISQDDEKRIRSFQFLTLKPEMVVFNVRENAGRDEADWARIAGEGVSYLTLCASLEMEVGQLPEADQAAFIEELGMGEPASARFLRASYELLGLQSFFTVGEDEVRAWTIRRGDDAVTAAGKVHTDLAKHFIRAEVVAFDDFRSNGDMKGARAAGKLRTEGKSYVVCDGDIVNVLHNA